MATLVRHGGERHYVRPDMVYRTSVLAPMAGYHPRADVMAVTAAFTQPSIVGLQTGLAGLGQANPIKRLGLRVRAAIADVQAKIAARRARKLMLAGLGHVPMLPAAAMGQQIAPQLAHQVNALMALAHAPNNAIAMRRINALYNAG